MTDLPELLPCAHCGGPASKYSEWRRNAGPIGLLIGCAGCGIQTRTCRTYDLAIAAWNRRTIAAGSVVVPVDFVRFLLGSESHDGVWFHDLHPTRQGRYWWRNDLQAMLDAAEGKNG